MIAYWYLKSSELSPTSTSASIVQIRAMRRIPAVSNHNPCGLQHLPNLWIVDYLRDRLGNAGIGRGQGMGGRSYLD